MAKKKEIWSSGVHYHKAVLAGNNICDTSMKNCHIKASDFSPKFQPGLVATTRPQGWCRTGPGVVKWPYVCDLECECGRSGIFNVISCGAVNYGCQLSTVNHCQLSSAQIVQLVRTPARRARGSWVEAGWKLARPLNAWTLNKLSWKLVEASALLPWRIRTMSHRCPRQNRRSWLLLLRRLVHCHRHE